MTVLEKGQIEIHTENIFPIIKKAVYSDHEIFLRELISNAVDAINKRRMASIAGDCIGGDEGQVKITIDKEEKFIKISDNGIGMSAEEVKRYINQVAFSSAEEFLERYQQENDGIIGHFGLGFYSSFMVAKNVELITKSAKENSQPIKWACDGSPKFSLYEQEKDEIGTDVILHLMDDELEYLEPTRIKTLITKYCDFMPIEIFLEGELINKRDPAWRKSPKQLKEQDYIDLYRYLYPFQGDPLMWIHLNTDYPYALQGILFFPNMSGRADWEKGEIKLYCNQVFVSDSIKEVVPRYLLPLRGVIDSPDIPLNVSRSALQTDRRVRSIGNFVAKKVGDKLKALKEEQPSFYAEIWNSIGPFIKIGAMEDEKFAAQVEDIIIFGTTLADNSDQGIISSGSSNYTTINGYKNRLTDSSNPKILYCTDKLAQATALKLWESHGAEVLNAETVIDTQFIPWLEDKNKDIKFVRVDSELDEGLKEEQSEITDKDGQTKSNTLKSLVENALNNEKITIQVQSLKSTDAPPAMILLPEQMRRINDIGALMEQKIPGLPDSHVFLLNLRHPIVQGLLSLKSATLIVGNEDESPAEAMTNELVNHLYDMARLGVGGLESNEIAGFQQRTSDLIGKLMKKSL